jgi:hypothetical protein
MPAFIGCEERAMRLLLAALVAAPFALGAATSPALADPPEEARSAMAACLAAVIDKAPVQTIKGTDVDIRRDGGIGPCTVEVRSGEPQEVRAAIVKAVTARKEGFAPSLTQWNAGDFGSQDTFCNALPARRSLNVVLTTAKPGAAGAVATATVLEPQKRDPRCDADLGVQPAPVG